jgi:hypothetical protein
MIWGERAWATGSPTNPMMRVLPVIMPDIAFYRSLGVIRDLD